MKTLWHWFSFKLVCCECARPHRISGAPWAWRVSHGCCLAAKASRLRQIERELQVRREILGRVEGRL